jgi:RsbT co-antagonist protein rsbRD N-terminal domain
MQNISSNDKAAIAKEWLKQTAATYPLQTVDFLLREKDPFRNPVGHALRTQLPVITEELLGEMDRTRLSAALENIVRIRAVQNFSASQSVEFIFLLKRILRDGCKQLEEDRVALEDRIEQAALMAFDLYMKCREKIYEVMADEARRRVAQVEKIYLAAESR